METLPNHKTHTKKNHFHEDEVFTQQCIYKRFTHANNDKINKYTNFNTKAQPGTTLKRCSNTTTHKHACANVLDIHRCK